MLKTRVMTAGVLLVLLGGILMLPPLGISLCLKGVMLWAGDEFLRLFEESKDKQVRLTFLSLLLLGFVVCEIMPVSPLLSLSGCWWLILVPMLLWQYGRTQRITCSRNIVLGILLLVFVPAVVGLEVLLRNYGRLGLIYCMGGIWVTDIGAFFIGRRYGKRRLASSISPNKTVEGFLGGVLSAILWGGVVGAILSFNYKALFFLRDSKKFVAVLLLFGLVGAVTAIGDLFESMLKRRAGVKDSGNLLPGHGGILDRIDGLLAAAPIIALGLQWIR